MLRSDDAVEVSAAFLALAALAWFVGDERMAAWIAAAGAVAALAAVFWGDKKP